MPSIDLATPIATVIVIQILAFRIRDLGERP